MTKLSLTNPLPATLRHFESELTQTLKRVNIDASSNDALPVEGQTGSLGKVRMLGSAVSNAFKYRDGDKPNIQLWPSLGLLEAILWHSHKQHNYVILHDPVPIRRQFGFDLASRMIARRAPLGEALPTIITHSDDAASEAKSILPLHQIAVASHPIADIQTITPKTRLPSVLVAGQYKPERNLDLLRALGPLLADNGISGHVIGRGWPTNIEGWSVKSEFVSQRDLDDAISESWVVLIPYHRYFQSGIAIRALELGTQFISPLNSFSQSVLGLGSELLVKRGGLATDYLAAIKAACSLSLSSETFSSYQTKTDTSWAKLFRSDVSRQV